ncbi:oligosaccharide flippase family protein, partial [Pseudomonas aeruginosa]|uniref:oligosaccharide flippase family protein n=1 Tax=Pseudomonas aeruginosa TaxID=287 RepID=UPI001F4B592A
GGGGLAAALVHFFAEYLVVDIFKVDRSSYEDALTGTRVAALCIPFFLASLVLQGYLEGVEDFYSFNKYRALSGTLTYLLPVAFLLFEKTFSSLIYGLLFARAGSCFLIALIVSRRCSVWTWRWDVKVFKTLISFGSWLTITNIISPVMVYMDKFLIARITGAGELAYYAAPSELINRMSILPVAITRAVFPRLSALGGAGICLCEETGSPLFWRIGSTYNYCSIFCSALGYGHMVGSRVLGDGCSGFPDHACRLFVQFDCTSSI